MSVSRLKSALDSEPVPRDLEARVRASLERPISPWPRLLPGLAMLGLMLVFLAFNGITGTNELLRVGLRDHLHCAIGGVYPKQDGNRAEMTKALGPYSLMLQPILDQTPGDPVVSAHRCTIAGRNYVHIIVRREGKLLSVMMTKREKGEAFPRLFSSGLYSKTQSVRDGELDGYSVSGFTAGGYFGYVASSLPMEQNRELAVKLAPVLRRYTGA
jgi:hypothetical protein